MKWLAITFFALLTFLKLSQSLKILTVFSTPVRSNSILGDSIVGHLVKAGHEVTHITAFPPKRARPNVSIVDVSHNRNVFGEDSLVKLGEVAAQQTLMSKLFSMVELSNITISNPNVQNLLNDENQHFDVVIVEWVFNEIYAGFAAVFECPLIWFSTMEPHWMILRIVDGLTNPDYSADALSDNVPPFSFRQRLMELWNQFWGIVLHTVYFWGVECDMYVNLFKPILQKRGRALLEYRDVMYNVSLVLSNSHVTLGSPLPLPQNFIPIGGFHIDDDLKPIQQEVQTLLDMSVDGVIYFSLGSTLKSRDLPKKIINDLIKLFSTLKETIIWKYEEHLPNRPPNVHILPWIPQNNVLAHENCVLFITQGGLLSITEAIHYSVPIIGVPIFGDHFANVNRAVSKGFAQKVLLTDSFAEDLDKAFSKARMSSRFQRKVNHLSLIYHDRLVPFSKEIVHWVEHVVKTRGALHLRSPSMLVTWSHRYYVDISLLVTLVIFVVYNELAKRLYIWMAPKEKVE